MVLWKKILLFIAILIFISIFIFKDYAILTLFLFIIFILLLIPWDKKSMINALFFGFAFLIISIIPFLADGICRNQYVHSDFGDLCVNLFELPWTPVLFFTEYIFGLKGEENFIVVILAPFLYTFLGILLGVMVSKKVGKKKCKVQR